MVTTPFKAKEVVPSHKVSSAPALTIGFELISTVKLSETGTGHTPAPIAVKVTVTEPDAPGLGRITGGTIGSALLIPPLIIVAGPEIPQV